MGKDDGNEENQFGFDVGLLLVTGMCAKMGLGKSDVAVRCGEMMAMTFGLGGWT